MIQRTSRRILITGATGQLGRELLRAKWPKTDQLIGFGRTDLDLGDPGSVRQQVLDASPDLIINAAAFTGVDAAETDEATAHRVNADSVGELVKAASSKGITLIHFSTDYVFDGSNSDWYYEEDRVSPLGAYGRTKRAGEEAAASYENALTLRTSWVYGALGNNFVRTMLRLADGRDSIGVVADQIGCPSATVDLAKAVVDIASDSSRSTQPLYHLASPEPASWFQFARAILEEKIDNGRVQVNPLTTAEFPTPTARPANSRLDSTAINRDFGIGLPRWTTTLPTVRDEILRTGLS